MSVVKMAHGGDRAKAYLVAACVLGLSAQGALAGPLDCREVESTSGRLACYDSAFPPKAKPPAAQDNMTSQDNGALRAGYKDPLAGEDARVATKLKNICRGC